MIVQPAFFPSPLEDGDSLVILTSENAYVLHTKGGEYAVYYNDELFGVLASEESIFVPPYCDLEIIQEGG